MSNKTLTYLVAGLIVISAVVVLFVYKKTQKPAIVPITAEQARNEAIVKDLNSFQPNPATAKAPEQVTKELNTYTPPQNNNTPSTTDVVNSLNSVQP